MHIIQFKIELGNNILLNIYYLNIKILSQYKKVDHLCYILKISYPNTRSKISIDSSHNRILKILCNFNSSDSVGGYEDQIITWKKVLGSPAKNIDTFAHM